MAIPWPQDAAGFLMELERALQLMAELLEMSALNTK